MKKWNNPKLMILGVENTTEDSTVYKPKVHEGYCHKEGGKCTGSVNDHSASGNKGHTWSGNPCLEHGDGNNGQPACCCLS